MFDYLYGEDALIRILVYGDALLVPALMALAAVAAIAKLPGTGAKTLGGIGFGLLFLTTLFFGLVRIRVIPTHDLPILFGHILDFVRWGAWVCVGVGLLAVSTRRLRTAEAPGTAPPGAATAYGRHPDSGSGSGWGLVSSWIVLSAIALATGIVFFGYYLDAGRRVSSSEWNEMLPFLVMSVLAGIPATVFWFVWLFQAWKAVPVQHRSATPASAVGFVFVPLFNLYWIFRAYPGLAASVRRTVDAVAPGHASGAGYGLGIAMCVLLLIPYVNILAWILALIWICVANAEKNRMLRLLEDAPAEPPPPHA